MVHNSTANDTTGDHYGVSLNSSVGLVLAQLQVAGEQVRLALSPSQARHLAALLVTNADIADTLLSR